MKRVPTLAAIADFLVHLIANPHYGFFRDELYFIICGMHPQWGYVDQPPLIPLLAAATQLFGHSLLLLRAVPALFAAGGAYVTCLLVVEFGGGVFAQAFAALVFFLTPVLMSFGMKVGTDETGLLFWPLIALAAVRIARGASPQLWLVAGLAAGLCFDSKYSVPFFLAALLAGLLATPERRILANGWLAAGAGLALLIALPNMLWQIHYGLPMLE
ncbi:MAG: glycosyltransferase family 39 protein, partial [Candidatus Eremiobacteraeota bacterium]|nr:glycosyltransferase family 39 protein [Candidatus Eremiobacteraeota bacterium]